MAVEIENADSSEASSRIYIENLNCEFIDIDNSEIGIIESKARTLYPVSWIVNSAVLKRVDTPFSLKAGDTVTLSLKYSPSSASVDFGLLTPDGMFYYVSVKTGKIDQILEAEEDNQYYFAVRNNSTGTIEVVGSVEC